MERWPLILFLLAFIAVPKTGWCFERLPQGAIARVGNVSDDGPRYLPASEEMSAPTTKGSRQDSTEFAQAGTLRERIRERRELVRERRENRGRDGWASPSDRREEFRRRAENLAREIREKLEQQLGLRSQAPSGTPPLERPALPTPKDTRAGSTMPQPNSVPMVAPSKGGVPTFGPRPGSAPMSPEPSTAIGPELFAPEGGPAEMNPRQAPGSTAQEPAGSGAAGSSAANSEKDPQPPAGTRDANKPLGGGPEESLHPGVAPAPIPQRAPQLPGLFSGLTSFFNKSPQKAEGGTAGGDKPQLPGISRPDSPNSSGGPSSKRSLAEIRRQILEQQQNQSTRSH